MFWFPEVYEMFYVETNDGFMRATRLPSDEIIEESEDNHLTLYFVDTGEQFKFKISELPLEHFYVMPEEIQEIPGLAIKCQLGENFVNHAFVDDQTFLEENVGLQEFKFHIVENREDVLVVNIMPMDDFDEWYYDHEDDQSGAELEEMLHQMEEIITTDEPQVAVQEFVTLDTNICEFYNPKTGGCFKGPSCKQRHVEKTSEGVFADKGLVYSFDQSQALINIHELPDNFKVEITEFVSVNRFICCYEENKQAMIEVVGLINDMTDHPSPLKMRPALRQLVIVKSENGVYLRARVEALEDDDQKFHVLLLDLGKTENIETKRLYDWFGELQSLPIYIMEMEIASIKPPYDGDKSKVAKEVLEIYQSEVGGIFNVEIVDDVNGIKCVLQDIEGEDIGLELARNGLAVEREFVPAVMKTRQFTHFILG